jgi:hypothetical protein
MFANLCAGAAALALGATAATAATLPRQAPPVLRAESWSLSEGRLTLRTSPPDAMVLVPFVQALVDYDTARRAGGRSSPQARQVEADLQVMAPGVKQELAAFARSLEQNHEAAAFDRIALIRARRSPDSGPVLAAIARAGGAYNGLTHIGPQIDALLPDEQITVLGALGELVGVSQARAAARESGCGFVVWMFTLGYGEDIAYRACRP